MMVLFGLWAWLATVARARSPQWGFFLTNLTIATSLVCIAAYQLFYHPPEWVHGETHNFLMFVCVICLFVGLPVACLAGMVLVGEMIEPS